jgi:hypothetical protein
VTQSEYPHPGVIEIDDCATVWVSATLLLISREGVTVNRALSDLLESTLDSWYGYLSTWQPPGTTGWQVCELCTSSPYSTVIGLSDWPHDVGHVLVRTLTTAADHVFDSLEDLSENRWRPSTNGREPTVVELAARRDALERHATLLVLKGVARHTDSMVNVLEECVTPRLERYLAVECELLIKDLQGIED